MLETETYTNPKYTRADISFRRFEDRIYVFDLASDNKIITARAPMEELFAGEDIISWLDEGDREETINYLLGYSEIPFLVRSKKGPMIFLANTVPSSSLGVAILSVLSVEDIVRVAKEIGDNITLASSISNEDVAVCRISKRIRELAEDRKKDKLAIDEGLGGINAKKKIPKEVKSSIFERINALSYLVGCPACIETRGREIMDYGDFEEGMFASFILTALMMARRWSATRGIDILVFEEKSMGIIVDLEMPIDEGEREIVPEIELFSNIAKRKNMYFDYALGKGYVYARFILATKDWAYLEVKHKDVFDWNG